MRQLDYFSDSERESQQRFRRWRDSALNPVVRLLTSLGVTANRATTAGLLGFVPFVAMMLAEPRRETLSWAVAAIMLHLLTDALDGPLARHQNRQSAAGSALDMICDHSCMVLAVTGLIAGNMVPGWLGCLYVYNYSLSVFLTVILNSQGRHVPPALRTKYVLYALICLHRITGLQWYVPMMTVACVCDGINILINIRGVIRFLNESE